MILRSQEIKNNICNENIEYLKKAISNNGINCAYSLMGETFLHVATKNNKEDIVRFLLEQGANIESKSIGELTPLHEASIYNALNSMKVLIENGADIEARTKNGHTPLHIMNYNNIKAFRYLLDCGADKEAKTNFGETPLHLAAGLNSQAVRMLIANGANIETKNNYLETPLHKSVMYTDNDERTKLLLQAGANIEARDRSGRTPLHRAMERNFRKVAFTLIQSAADMNTRDLYGQTPLHIAATYAFTDLMKDLIAKGADYTIRDEQGRTCIDILKSTENGFFHMREFRRYEIKVKNAGMNRILLRLCDDLEDIKDVMEEIKECVEKGECINTVDNGGMTVLHWAAAYKNIKAMKELIEIGASDNIRNNKGRNCLDMLGGIELESVREIRAFIVQRKLNKRGLNNSCCRCLWTLI